jgi:hypothetical protein
MLAYHNAPAIKAKYVARFAAHRAADEVIQGSGFDNGRGCFVGCTLNKYDHALFPVELGWPEWLARLADTIFEGLPREEAPQFGTDLLDAVPVGVDLDPVRNRFLLTVQRRNLDRLAGNDAPYALQVRSAIEGVILLLENPESAVWSMWPAARSVWPTESAARSAAWAVWSAESAAWSESAAVWPARSAESAARSAAWSAVWSMWPAAWSEEFQTQRHDLLSLIRKCEKA